MNRILIRLGQAGAATTLLAAAGCAMVSPHPKQVVISQQCTDIDFPVYFEAKSAALTKPARRVIADAGRGAKGCTVASVSVVGLSGGRSSSERLLDISSKRASTVAKALTDAGLPAPKFDVSAVANGQAPADASREPLQRRAEVIIQFAH
jgi:outer membrane protein OmpA-like peptidoglycan-associated protein